MVTVYYRGDSPPPQTLLPMVEEEEYKYGPIDFMEGKWRLFCLQLI